ncbi:MAG: alanine--tRNA ligase, partial [Hyphomicrobiaceae bacterium]|nr:alanine--tRNA ligase [Hyphomicrobiaceae bacterium]
DVRKKLALGGGASGGAEAKSVNGLSFLGQTVNGVQPKELKGLVDEAKKRLGSGVAAMIAVAEDGKAAVVVGVTEDLVNKANAVDLVRTASEVLGGKGGGGRPDMAQAGGPDGSKADDALAAIEAQLAAV